jgi:DNA repair protein RecO
MNQIITSGIVLSRTNFQEADKIMTLLTPDHGKVSVLARGVRKSKSKLATGIELFSVSEISFIRGRGELSTLVSARLKKHYGNIVQDINRTMTGYELIKLLNKVTEDAPGPEYYDLLWHVYESLDDKKISLDLIRLWFYAQLLQLAGHSPNLRTDNKKRALDATVKYDFDNDGMTFAANQDGLYGPDHIKFLRLVFAGNKPRILQKIKSSDILAPSCLRLIGAILPQHIKT